jgi:hypothetical protein
MATRMPTCTAAHLVKVSCGELPRLGGEVDVVAVVDLGQVVEAVALLGVRQRVAARSSSSSSSSKKSVRKLASVTADRLHVRPTAAEGDWLGAVTVCMQQLSFPSTRIPNIFCRLVLSVKCYNCYL